MSLWLQSWRFATWASSSIANWRSFLTSTVWWKLCFFHLRQLRLIRRSLTNDTTHALVRALVHSRLDYCNGVLAGLPINQVNRLQSILRTAARLVLRLPGRASVTDRMRDDLHWLDVSKRVTFKHCVLAFKCQTRSRTILPNVVVCAVVDRAGSCQPQISKHKHLAPSTNKNKNDRAARIFLLLPSGMEQPPQCSQNLGPIAVRFQEKPENVSFSKLILL